MKKFRSKKLIDDNLEHAGIKINEFIGEKTLTAEDLIKKALAICKLVSCLENLKQKKENC